MDIDPKAKKQLDEGGEVMDRFDLEMRCAKINKDLDKSEEVAKLMTTVASALDDYSMHMTLPNMLGKHFMPVVCPDPTRNTFMERMVDGYTFYHMCPELVKSLDFMWENQKKDEHGYGDLDVYFAKLVDKEHVRVSLMRNTCTCSDINKWIIMEQKFPKEAGGGRWKIHVRHYCDEEESDYPKAQYPKKIGLKFWEDRDYICDFVKDWQFTNKGGVYGDERDYDKGYIISFEPKFGSQTGGPEACMMHYQEMCQFMQDLSWIKTDLEENPDEA